MQARRGAMWMRDAADETPTAARGEITGAEAERLWTLVQSRDRTADGSVVYAVRSTGVYCRPSCPSRRPRRERVRFFRRAEEAVAAGFRACKRCQPDAPRDEQAEAIRCVREHIEANLDADLSLDALSRVAFLSPTHLQRVFKRLVGVTPRQYVEAQRRERFKRRLRDGAPVTQALYDAGYRSSSSLYAQAPATLGMTPGAYQSGGRGMTIGYTTVASPLGRLLVAATERGVCAVYFGEDDAELVATLAREYPAATLTTPPDARAGAPARAALDAYAGAILGALEGRDTRAALAQAPLDVPATPFQRRVWEALREIPAGQTRSYAEIARVIGQPRATRAVANACASNAVALVIPCHRVRRADGALGGYRWGVERKRALLAREGALD